MSGKPIYSLFPLPNSPTDPPQSPPPPPTTPPTSLPKHRPRHSVDRKRQTSLDPLPPIEEPPHPPPAPASESPVPESPVLKPIHSLYNPQPRPSSRRQHNDRLSERRQSLTRPLPSADDLPPLDRNLPLDSQHQQPQQHNPPPAPPLSRSSSLKTHPNPPKLSPLQTDCPPRPSTAQDMHLAAANVPSPSSSSSNSLTKPPVFSPSSTVGPGKPFPPNNHPTTKQTHFNQTPYFHGGLGGRGNYRKVVREGKNTPLAYAPNAGPLSGRSKFLSSLFGGRKGRREVEEIRPSGQGSEDSRSGGSRNSEREEVALGAAEVMRRKLLRQAGVKSGRRDRDREW